MKKCSEKPDNIHRGHRDRMRKRFISTGFTGFNEYQIIEMLLFCAYPRIDTNETAHILTEEFGSAAGVIAADPEKIRKLLEKKKTTDSGIMLLKLISCIYSRYFSGSGETPKYSPESITSEHFGDVLKAAFRTAMIGERGESFAVTLFFPNSSSPLRTEIICRGKSIPESIGMRNIMRYITEKQAYAAAAAHGIPDMIPQPTLQDRIFAEKLARLLDRSGIIFIDYIIMAENSSFSFRNDSAENLFV